MTETKGTIEIRDLHAAVEGKTILRGVDLTVRRGEVHAMMGPNGSGKSTLASVIMGRPGYEPTQGDVLLDGESILGLPPDERARRGLFLAFQYPVEVPGVSVVNFLRTAYNAAKGEEMAALAFRKYLKEKMATVGVDDDMVRRYVNQGFSGGEKKRMETLQLAVLDPRFAILDETDSGLDIDALKAVAEGINELAGPDLGILLITHYQRILNYVEPQFVHVLMAGRIVKQGGPELAAELEEKGYEGVRAELGIEATGDEAEGEPARA
jgi:Fe-S cluster assembly ATP-binding protein